MNENIEDNKNVYNLDLKDLEGEIWKDVVDTRMNIEFQILEE